MTSLVRLGFIGLILLGLASQAIRSNRGNHDSDSVSDLAARMQAFAFKTRPLESGGTVEAMTPDCPEPVYAMLLRIDGSENERLNEFGGPDVVRRFVYLGAVDERPGLATTLARWAWTSLLFDVGIRSGRPATSLVAVLLPRACRALAAVDWAELSPRN